jgi:hypothetical protein
MHHESVIGGDLVLGLEDGTTQYRLRLEIS